MSVISVGETHLGRGGLTTQPGRIMRRRMFVVQTDSRYDTDRTVKSYPGLPQLYQPYQTVAEFDNRCVVRTVDARQDDLNRYLWRVMVEYDSEFTLRDNPFLEPPDIRVDSEVYEEPLPGRAKPIYDVEQEQPQSEEPTEAGQEAIAWGEGITTSAGEPYDPPATRQASRPIVIYTRNEPNFQMAQKVKYENTVNSAPWSGLQSRQAWLRSIRAQVHKQEQTDIQQPAIWYWRVEYTFALKAETWDLVLLDYGTYYIRYENGGANRSRVAFKVEGTGEPRLGLLDNSDPEEPGKPLPINGTPKFNRWRVYREENYAALGIFLNLSLQNINPRRRRS